jgi:outer membrane protein assembly factor BamD (BamD/ComL family)
MNEALDMCGKMTPDERCALVNRMADIYLKHKKDRAAAIKILSRIIDEYPKSASAGYAQERIAALRE